MTDRSSSGGMANWTGAAFELRLGVEFCVYILIGDAAGFGCGAATRVQLQAPEPVDDLVLEFDTGARWAVQAKAGSSVRVEWNPDRPFGKALRQLYDGATSDQIDLSADSLDRVELAVDHQAPQSVTRFGGWLDKARHHLDWEHFAAACTNKDERGFVRQLPAFLGTEGDDRLLAFLKHLRVRWAPNPDQWWSQLRSRLIVSGVPDDKADAVLDVLLAQVADVAPMLASSTPRPCTVPAPPSRECPAPRSAPSACSSTPTKTPSTRPWTCPPSAWTALCPAPNWPRPWPRKQARWWPANRASARATPSSAWH
jgi:hypothetical protein